MAIRNQHKAIESQGIPYTSQQHYPHKGKPMNSVFPATIMLGRVRRSGEFGIRRGVPG